MYNDLRQIDDRPALAALRCSPCCSHCGELVDTPVELTYQGRSFTLHLYCLFDVPGLAALLIPLTPAGVPL